MDSEQLRAARALLRWSQQDLSERCGVSVPTIKRLEAMDGELSGHSSTIRSIEQAMEAAGVLFIPENGGGAGVRLAKPRLAKVSDASE
jgi:transcriptional regulator with XRE-family HTH domain